MIGIKLKPDQGAGRRAVTLTDPKTGEVQQLQLKYDLNAVMRHESEFELPLQGIMAEIGEQVRKAGPKDKDGNSIMKPGQVAAEVAAEMVRRRLTPGQIKDFAQWAYALTETFREDNEIEISWAQFRRMLPAPPPMGAATKKAVAKLEAATAWMMAVAEIRAREELDDDEGNDLADEAGPGAQSEAVRESTGTESITAPPSNGDAPTES